jgi:hypothetical protein
MILKIFYLFLIFVKIIETTIGYELVKAINLGGEAVEDSKGINYLKDPVADFEYNYGNFDVTGVPEMDKIIYQTMNSYKKIDISLPVTGDGLYLLIMKFMESLDYNNFMKSYLNGHKIFEKFYVYKIAGESVAYDEHVFFTVCGNQLQYKNDNSIIVNNQINLNIACDSDGCEDDEEKYARVSAYVLIKGDVETYEIINGSGGSINKEHLTHKCNSPPKKTKVGGALVVNIYFSDLTIFYNPVQNEGPTSSEKIMPTMIEL